MDSICQLHEIEQFHKNGSIIILSLNNRFLRDSEGNPIGLYGVARDVTALKIAERKLRESEERFKKLSGLTIEGIVIHKNTKVVDVNEAFENLVGYSRNELLGQSILELLIHPKSHQVVKENLLKSRTEPYHVIGIKNGGFLFDAEIEARDIDYDGQEFRVAAVRDVTERNKLQRRLEQTNRHNEFLSRLSFRLASENIDIIKQIALPMIKEHCGAVYAHFSTYHAATKTLQLVHIDADSAIVNLVKKVGGSKIFNTLTPVSEDAYRYILANNCKLMHSLDELSFGEIPPLVDKAVKAATGFRFFYAIAHVLGNQLYGVTVLAFRKDQVLPHEEVLRSYANIMAVSIKNSLATARLVASEHKLKTLIENIPDLLFHMDKNGRFLDFYQSHREDSLYKPPSDFIQKTIHDIFTVELAEKMQNAIDEAFEKGFCMLEYDMVEDNQRYFMARLVKLNNDEVLSIVSDITQLKLYAKELEVLNATKDRLFSIIGHDLKNGLNNIIGFAQLIESRMGEEVLCDKYQKYNKLILQSGLSIANLLNNLLTWARAQRKQIVVSPVMFNLHLLIDECYELHRAAFDDKRIVFSNDVSDEVDMCADRSMMHTVFRNLIVNACKFTPRDGAVSVNSEYLKQHISIRVVDNGIGMEVSKIQSLFEITDTSSIRGTEGEEGTGLGLVICKEFVELNGGTIGVESSLGEGTAFIVKIPLKQTC